jgi:uncharacterized protein YnzC (UPF0291/DUF896 family)
LLDKRKIERINELSKKKKTTGLTPEETAEQLELRKEYLSSFRKSFKGQLDKFEWTD